MSDILKGLKFVQGAVAKKDFVPALKHFIIENNRVRGFNGILALCTPISFDIKCKPEATTLIKAIGNCEDIVSLALTKAGSLSIKSGVFKVNIKCIEEDTPHVEPEGNVVNFDGEKLLAGIKAVAPFISNDASRMWANGILVKEGSLFATNNVMLVQYWLGVQFPKTINIPLAAIKEMLRINEAPIFAQVAENSITFHYSEDRWLRTQLYITEWPDLAKIVNKESVQAPVDQRLFKGLDTIRPFVGKTGVVIFKDNHLCTHDDESEGASYFIPDIHWDGRYNIEMLSLLEGTAETIDWSMYPGACIFQGGMLRGAIIGMKL